MFKVTDDDALFFPFAPADLGSSAGATLAGEYNQYLRRWGAFHVGDTWTYDTRQNARLYVIGHGTNEAGYKSFLQAEAGGNVTVSEIAKRIKDFNFPVGPGHDVVAWSCQSGGVGNFAQLLTLYLLNQGYSGHKVWGSKLATGMMTGDGTLMVKPDGGVQRAAVDDDLDHYIGIGGPRGG